MTHADKLAILVVECERSAHHRTRLALLLPDVLNDYLLANVVRFDDYLATKRSDHDLINRLWNAYMIKQLTS